MINEGGRFTKPSDKLEGEQAEKAWKKYDNDLFQTGRLYVGGSSVEYLLTHVVLSAVCTSTLHFTTTFVLSST
jgi:linoleate 10R-lipoxygenase